MEMTMSQVSWGTEAMAWAMTIAGNPNLPANGIVRDDDHEGVYVVYGRHGDESTIRQRLHAAALVPLGAGVSYPHVVAFIVRPADPRVLADLLQPAAA
jgi:hypothetical protein